MITVQNVSKTIGRRPIVHDVSFTVADGSITGFVGPNGAGKSTTMRIMLGLTHANTGTVTFDGLDYQDAPVPLSLVGSLLDARSLVPNLKVHELLDYCAYTQQIAPKTGDLLALVGLETARNRKVAHLSLGMRQRLGIAVALIADPHNLVLDEPQNGLDPSGISWLRNLLRDLSSRGCAILLSSHIISELALVADNAVILNGGRVVLTGALSELASHGRHAVAVRTDQPTLLAAAISSTDGKLEPTSDGMLMVNGLAARDIFSIAAAQGIILDELIPTHHTLDDIYRNAIGTNLSQEPA